MSSIVALLSVLAFIAGSMIYVYRFRGDQRYDDFRQYLRKGWPIFAPLNCLLYLFTEQRAQRPIMDLERFAELEEIQRHWPTIRAEALAMHADDVFEQTTQDTAGGQYDIGFRTFHKYGWRKFYLHWYGTTHNSARRLCPQTTRLLENIDCVNGAMFSVLPAGSKLTRHADPAACSLRYHLGLATPNDDACRINIDGTDYSWRDGRALLFDETYLHYANNDTDSDRVILMCDIERPTRVIGPFVNFVYKRLMRATVVPNTAEDERGLVSGIFARVAPALSNTQALKYSHPMRYKAIKYSVNGTLMILVSGMLFGAIAGLYALGLAAT